MISIQLIRIIAFVLTLVMIVRATVLRKSELDIETLAIVVQIYATFYGVATAPQKSCQVSLTHLIAHIARPQLPNIPCIPSWCPIKCRPTITSRSSENNVYEPLKLVVYTKTLASFRLGPR